MSGRNLQKFDEYRYGPRSLLRPGDLFRVSGGPVYQNNDGSTSLMAERGVFKFVRYCEKGASKWIEAHAVGGGTVVLWVGKAGPNKDLPSFKRKPYKVRKVTERKRKPTKGKIAAGDPVAKTRRAKGTKPKSKAPGSTMGRRRVGGNPGETGVGKRRGRAKDAPSTSGSTSV